jgi:hypothetical protein
MPLPCRYTHYERASRRRLAGMPPRWWRVILGNGDADGMEEIMERVRSLASFAAALTVALAATARPAAAVTVPSRASFSGSFVVVDRVCPNGDDHLHFTGAGIATHGGASTVAGDTCLHPKPANPARLIIDTDATTFTVADRSAIRLVGSGEDCLNHATGQITGSGTCSITGGTGRFDGAGGSGEVSLAAQLVQVWEAKPPEPSAC